MAKSDLSEKGLESLIVQTLLDAARYQPGNPADFDRDHAVNLAKLIDFLRATQPEAMEQLKLESDGPDRSKFLARLQGEIAKRGIIDVLRKGIERVPPKDAAPVDPEDTDLDENGDEELVEDNEGGLAEEVADAAD